MFNDRQISEICTLAKESNVPPAALLAVAEVESAGVIFWKVHGKNRPPIRFEGHYFWRRLKGQKRDLAYEQGLAHPQAGYVKNPYSYAGRYDMLKRAVAIDPRAAIESTSWGVGQVMGTHWRKLGYSSPGALAVACEVGLIGQVDLMLSFIIKNRLDLYLHNRNWRKFARRYNGPAYRKNRYAVKMKAAYKRWVRRLGGEYVSPDIELVKLLGSVGYLPSKHGGRQKAVAAFQSDHGLVVDGIAGPMTMRMLEKVKRGNFKKKLKAVVKVGAPAAPGTAFGLANISEIMSAGDEAANAGDSARGVLELFGLPDWVVMIGVGVVVGGILYFAIREIFDDEEEGEQWA